MSTKAYIEKPCQHCPYRNDVKLFLHAARGEELAYHATNHYNSFPCHKTTVSDDDSGERLVVGTTKECAGFLTLMAQECGEDQVPKGFKPSYDIVYSDVYEMADAYEMEEDQ